MKTKPITLSDFTWQRGVAGGWYIYATASLFRPTPNAQRRLIAEGPAGSLSIGRDLFAHLTDATVEEIWPHGTEPLPSE